jgi:hypothetical protein
VTEIPFSFDNELSTKLIILNLSSFSLEISPEGRGLFFDQKSGEMLSLNKTGAFIIENLREAITFEDLAEAFSRKFGLSPHAAETDLREFLSTLYEMKLLQFVEVK